MLQSIREETPDTDEEDRGREKEVGAVSVSVSASSADILEQSEACEPGADDVISPVKPSAGPRRQEWDRPLDFLFSCLSMSVGLGNVWRFPFTAYENGGGAFLIPYLVVLVLISRPFYLLELGLGQFSSSGPGKVWDLCPPFRGVGYAQSFAAFIVCSYYCVLIAISMVFLVSSFHATLPWTECHEELADNFTLCLPSSFNSSELENPLNLPLVASTEQFFRRGVLKEKSSVNGGLGAPDLHLTGGLALCWLLVYLTLHRGVSGSGKVAYFTALFPYLVMLVLLAKVLTLPGAAAGVVFLFTPQWDKLYDPKVWYAAVTQSFFSLSIGFGALTAFSSHNKFRHNIYRDATIVSMADTFTSVLAAVITFSVLGALAHQLDLPVSQVVKSGAGLAFTSYPELIGQFRHVPQLFAVLFFLMLITLGLGSASGLINSLVSVLEDRLPAVPRPALTGAVSAAGFVCGLVYTTPGGQPILQLVDYYGGSLLILVLAVTEAAALAWVYTTSSLLRDLGFMLGRRLGLYWRLSFDFLLPVSLAGILGYSLVLHNPVSYAGTELPAPAQVCGWILTLGPVVGALVYYFFSVLVPGDRVGRVFSPLPSWGPRDTEERIRWVGLQAEDDLPVVVVQTRTKL